MNSKMKRTACGLGLAMALSLAGTSAFAGVLKTPYLIYPGVNSQMTVLWQDTATEAGNVLTWDTDPTFSTNPHNMTVPEYASWNQHKYTITGLTPDTKYYYKVVDPTNGTYGTGSFWTAPAATSTHVKFLGMGDSRSQP
jgi:phosphodiesterase/alkaline phosphatase D-like protein